MRKLILSSLLTLSMCGAVFAQDATCDVNNKESTLQALASNHNIQLLDMKGALLTAFNAELATEHDSDVTKFPEMDSVEVAIMPAQTGEEDGNVAVLFAFNKGCYVSSITLPEQAFKNIIARTQAAK